MAPRAPPSHPFFRAAEAAQGASVHLLEYFCGLVSMKSSAERLGGSELFLLKKRIEQLSKAPEYRPPPSPPVSFCVGPWPFWQSGIWERERAYQSAKRAYGEPRRVYQSAMVRDGVVSLLAEARGEAVRISCASGGRDHSGLGAAVRRRRRTSAKVWRQRLQLDVAFSFAWHATEPRVQTLLQGCRRELFASHGSAAHAGSMYDEGSGNVPPSGEVNGPVGDSSEQSRGAPRAAARMAKSAAACSEGHAFRIAD